MTVRVWDGIVNNSAGRGYTSRMQFDLHELELPIRLRTERRMSDDELMRFSSVNEPLRIEQESNGDLLVMSPTGSGGGNLNAEILGDLILWSRQDGRGLVFDSNAGFRLPDGSVRAPDAAWVSWARWNALTGEEQRRYAPLCPEFVIELRSANDRLPDLQQKTRMWLGQGAELAWLVDPERKVVEIYRPGCEAEIVEGASAVYGDGPVSGFVLELTRLWA